MNKIFRKNRQNSLTEGKATNYLKYAIGEIILVIIGILIAIQINNWNENRKLKEKELWNIQSLVKEIKSNNDILKGMFKIDSINRLNAKKILVFLKNKDSKYQDSMGYVFYSTLDPFIFSSRRTAYENLKAIDFSIIKSNSIREKIITVYDELYSILENEENNRRYEYSKKINEIIQNNFERTEINKIVPNDYEDLKKNKNFTNFLSFYIYNKQELYETSYTMYLEIEKYLRNIEDYLKEIKN
jgi:hypothetical protein